MVRNVESMSQGGARLAPRKNFQKTCFRPGENKFFGNFCLLFLPSGPKSVLFFKHRQKTCFRSGTNKFFGDFSLKFLPSAWAIVCKHRQKTCFRPGTNKFFGDFSLKFLPSLCFF